MLSIVSSRQHNDCGVCAVACATGVSWDEADQSIFGAVKPRNRAATGRKLIRGLPLGWKALSHRMKGVCFNNYRGWPDVPALLPHQRAIIKVHYEDSRYGHWIVWDGSHVYDSNHRVPELPTQYPYRPLGYIILEEEL